jgi:carbon starvation protein
MNALIIIAVTFAGYILAYNTYGKWVSRKIFAINPNAITPAVALEDGKDYVPTKKGVIFGHHFTSIAGTGPIVGPAIGVIWGWLPALLWVFLGAIFMGAVHDLSALIISLRNDGKSIAEITSSIINKRVRSLFFLLIFLALLIVIAIFGLVIAIIFKLFPSSVFPVWIQIPISIALGHFVYKRGVNLTFATAIAVFGMYLSIFLGQIMPFTLPSMGGIPATGIWTIILLFYAFAASVLPVTTLLQPRDYINAWQLYIALAVILLGVLWAGVSGQLTLAAPMINSAPIGAPPMWPFLFITISCGAISGFHSLVSSGTTAKQLSNESHARFVGYGAMLIESGLAVLVIVAVTAGIAMAYTTPAGITLTGTAAWQAHYGSWGALSGLGSKINAVVVGTANIMATIGIPKSLGIVIMGVFIASFAGTTLDTSTRIQRYIISELFQHTPFRDYMNRWSATAIAVITAAALAFSTGADGKGALILWPMFGAVNQLLGALALLVATIYLKKKGGLKYLVTGLPFLFMIVITLWATIANQLQFIAQHQSLLVIINGIIILLATAITCEAVAVFFRHTKTKPMI